ncbi:leucine carboxyl methyltransferase (macronuclear) [Tetrahymena thermophila SB210]|uniref:Leucine carboxyl methyltransferase 1 n=1 Tax=Tetrahymena thermophila (strain SB210) TaxID=312017 RepID=W7WZC8_TETTS|nr:leucine carboxyl methyltransferase [Tetrahymena thermophila SB210]EWS72250.1 leucine carboxyl methyltransferase [Tetrahymena thermophila SB210]|eukprot:XP_012655190.1 leucine carboxyl methyltransferase [Tetrahymena thermophila SB210]
MDNNYSVEDTNAEAMASKLSAVHKGYFQDNFAEEFVHTQGRKDIIIHRGYWSRVNIFTLLIERFLLNSKNEKKQIISLGCGYDTHYYILRESKQFKDLDFHYVEIDLINVVKNKIKRIQNSNKIKQVIGEFTLDDAKSSLHAKNYSLYPSDITKIDEFKENLVKCGIDFSVPTFIFAECVMTYIESKFSDELLKSIASTFDLAYFSSYEMFNPNDPFGKMMVKNFDRKGCPLVGIHDYPTIESQHERLTKLGFNTNEVYHMLDIYNKFTDQNERKRIEKLEMMDEFEEWIIMQQHYFLSLAVRISKTAHDNPQLQELINNLKINTQHH